MVVDIGLKDCEGNKEASLTVYCVSLISYGLQEVMSARMGVREVVSERRRVQWFSLMNF